MSDSPPSGNKRAAASPPVAEPEADTPDAKKTKQGSEPVALGYKTFKNGREATVYFHKLVQDWPANVDLNPYELNVVESLLTSGHPDSAKKVGDGLRAIQVRVNHAFDPPSRCFFVVRKDGTMEDFSYRKCLAGVFPDLEHGGGAGKQKGGGRGGKGGRGGRGRGRGRGRR